MDLVSRGVGISVLHSKPSEHTKEVEMSSIPETSQPDRGPAVTVLLPKNLDPVGLSDDDPAECTPQLTPLLETVQSLPDPKQAIGPSENDSAECTTQLTPLPETVQSAADPKQTIGASENDPAECTTQLTPLPETVQSASDPKQTIGASENVPTECTTRLTPLPETVQSAADPKQTIGASENDRAECTTRLTPLPETVQSASDPKQTIGPSENDPAECTTQLTPLPETVQSSPDPKQAIGPYLTSAGIDKTSFSPGLTELPRITELRNGLVLELYYYFTKTLKKSQCEFVKTLIVIGGHTEVKMINVCGYIRRIVERRKYINQKMRGAQKRYALDQLLNKEFRFVRSLKTKESRKRILMDDLSSPRMKTRGLKRKLGNSEAECTPQLTPLPETVQSASNPKQTIGTSENDPAKCTTRLTPLPKTVLSSPDPKQTIGPSENEPAECATRLTPLPETVQSSPDPKQAIGPYLTSAGIDKTSFSPGLTELPRITELKNGLVLELYYYFTKTLKKSQREFVKTLIVIGGHTEVKMINVCGYIRRIVERRKYINQKMRGAQKRYALDQLLNKEFRFVRSLKTKEPRRRILMDDLSSPRMKTRGLKRKLGNSEVDRYALKVHVAALQNEALEERHYEEIQDKQVYDKLALIDAVDRQGGFWKTPAIIEREYVKLQDKNENTIKRAIHDQLQFVRKVLQVTGPEKEFFQLSKSSDGIKVEFTKEEMKARLIELVLRLHQPRTRVKDNRSSTSSKAHSDAAKSVESSEEECYIKKRKIFEEILASRMERAIQSKQQHLDSLLQNPSLLIGRTINLAFRNERETLPNWCKGVVIGMAKEDEKPLLTEFCVDFTQYEDQNRLEWVFILRLIEDLKNNDLIIHTS